MAPRRARGTHTGTCTIAAPEARRAAMTQTNSHMEPGEGRDRGQGQAGEHGQGQATAPTIPPIEGYSRGSGLSLPVHSLSRFSPLPSILPALIGLFLFCLALGCNLYRLGVPSIWFDEAFSVELARQPLPLLWHIIFGPEPNMELYYLFLHFWLALTGSLGLPPTEAVVRFPSAIFAALSTIVVYGLGRRYINPLAGFVGAGLYLLNDLQLVYAQQARSYSLQLLLICIAWYAFFAAITTESYQKRWW